MAPKVAFNIGETGQVNNTVDLTGTTPVVPIVSAPPRNQPADHVVATPFAGAYKSRFLSLDGTGPVLPLLNHVNCSYLSTTGVAPTLLQLKQHAQALAILIKYHTVSTSDVELPGALDPSPGIETAGTAEVINEAQAEAEQQARRARAEAVTNQSWDWITNLNAIYTNDDPDHQIPLTSIMNNLETFNNRVRRICPLHNVRDGGPTDNALPYADLSNLVRHVNEALTIIDHEMSFSGGLLSLLPLNHPSTTAAIQNTILGQWIHFTRLLTSRVHELERSYAIALDALAGEATVPRAMMWDVHAGNRVGTGVHPQDRFIMANVGEDVMRWFKNILGDATRDNNAVLEDGKGITFVDVTTRYIRLRGGMTIFVVPDPAKKLTDVTLPGVVQVIKPEFRARPSKLEADLQEKLQANARLVPENYDLKRKVEELQADCLVLQGSNEDRAARAQFLAEVGNMEQIRAAMRETLRREFIQETDRLEQRENELDARERDVDTNVAARMSQLVSEEIVRRERVSNAARAATRRNNAARRNPRTPDQINATREIVRTAAELANAVRDRDAAVAALAEVDRDEAVIRQQLPPPANLNILSRAQQRARGDVDAANAAVARCQAAKNDAEAALIAVEEAITTARDRPPVENAAQIAAAHEVTRLTDVLNNARIARDTALSRRPQNPGSPTRSGDAEADFLLAENAVRDAENDLEAAVLTRAVADVMADEDRHKALDERERAAPPLVPSPAQTAALEAVTRAANVLARARAAKDTADTAKAAADRSATPALTAEQLAANTRVRETIGRLRLSSVAKFNANHSRPPVAAEITAANAAFDAAQAEKVAANAAKLVADNAALPPKTAEQTAADATFDTCRTELDEARTAGDEARVAAALTALEGARVAKKAVDDAILTDEQRAANAACEAADAVFVTALAGYDLRVLEREVVDAETVRERKAREREDMGVIPDVVELQEGLLMREGAGLKRGADTQNDNARGQRKSRRVVGAAQA